MIERAWLYFCHGQRGNGYVIPNRTKNKLTDI